jgi:hypothetical protein
MSGRELQYYLMESGLFKVDITCYMIEIDESGRVFNQIPTSYKGFSMGKVEVDIVRYKHGEQEQWVEFTFGGVNLFACHKLKDLDFKTLYQELNKIYGFDPKFIQWSKVELRNYKIKQIL